MSEMNENSPEIFVILLDAVIKFFDVTLIQESQNFFLELAAVFAGDDLDRLSFLFDGLFRVDFPSAVVDVMQVEF